MARAKSVAARGHRKTKRLAKGYKHARSRRVKAAKEAILHAGQYAFHGRKLRKRDLRKLWIVRLNAAARENGLTYKSLITGLKDKEIKINRKILADIAARDPKAFEAIVKKIK